MSGQASSLPYTGPVVIGTGLPRTGTTSLQVALGALGFAPCSHFRGDFINDSFPWPMSRRWRAACYATDKKERQKIIHGIFKDRRWLSATDYPASLFVEDLVEMYPNAKFVHCERTSAQVWRDSVNESIGQTQDPIWSVLLLPFLPFTFSIKPVLRAFQWRTLREWDAKIWAPKGDVKLYHAHNAWVKRVVPKEKLLEFNPKDGYPVLCEFIGCEIPKDAQGNDMKYPHVNDRESMQKGFRIFTTVSISLWGVLFAGAAYALNRYGYIDVPAMLKTLKL